MRRGAASGRGDPTRTTSGSSSAVSPGARSAATTTPGSRSAGASSLSQEMGEHASPDLAHVLCPLTHVVVLKGLPPARHALDRVSPRNGARLARGDPGTGRIEQCVVLEEEQVGSEDLRLVVAAPDGDIVLRAADRCARPVERCLERLQLSRGIGGRAFGDLEVGSAEAAHGPDRDPRGRGEADELPVASAGGLRAHLRRSRAGATPSPKPLSASAVSAARTAASCGPRARTTSSCPWRTPSVATAFRLRAETDRRR